MAQEIAQLYALISVFAKDGIDRFAKDLIDLGYRIISSGGTYKYLLAHGVDAISVQEFRQQSLRRRLSAANDRRESGERINTDMIDWISDVLGRAEMLDHRVATLHAEIHGGLLATDEMVNELEALGMVKIGLVCVDFYPLHEELARTGATIQTIFDKMDVGGPAQSTAASKGQRIIVCCPEDRQPTIKWLRGDQLDNDAFRTRMAAKALANNLAYYGPLVERLSDGQYSVLVLERAAQLGYAENRWMGGADLMRRFGSKGREARGALSTFELREGSAPGYVNYTDADGGRRLIARIENFFRANSLSVPLISVGLKHGNTCGVGLGDFADPRGKLRSIKGMVEGDPEALFGGTVMTNFVIGGAEAALLRIYRTGKEKRPIDAVWATTITEDARKELRRVNQRCRMMVSPHFNYGTTELSSTSRFRQLEADEFLRQGPGDRVFALDDSRLDRLGRLTKQQKRDMLLGLAICGATNSNTIVITKNGKLEGLGLCENSRVVACQHAVSGAGRCGHDLTNSVAVSDSFFPFNDGPHALVSAGVAAIFATTGSRNDAAFKALCRDGKRPVKLVTGPDAEFRMFCKH